MKWTQEFDGVVPPRLAVVTNLKRDLADEISRNTMSTEEITRSKRMQTFVAALFVSGYTVPDIVASADGLLTYSQVTSILRRSVFSLLKSHYFNYLKSLHYVHE